MYGIGFVRNKIYFCDVALKTLVMNSCVNISIPKSDMSFLKKLAKNMGWEIRAEEDIIIPGIEQGLKDIEEGNIFYAKNADDMIQQILK